jgi:predicted phage tail protein
VTEPNDPQPGKLFVSRPAVRAHGAKGGDAPKPPPPPVEDPNTLQSHARGRVLYALGEGPFEGIVGGYAQGAKNIFLNDTPLMNADGTLNFQGVTWDYRVGTPDQAWIEGFPAVENVHSGDVGLPVEIKRSTPAIRSVTNTNANAVRIIVSTPGMVDQDVKTGNARGTRIDFVIRIRRQGRSGWEAEYPIAIIGKTVSTYEEQYRLGLPGDGPWDVMVERLTPDSDRASLNNGLSWVSYTEIIDRKMRYPNTALLSITFDAKTFGNSMPTVTSRWDTWVVKVPSNYDPVSRTYNGVWNGAWKNAFTSNPAYLFRALLTHRAGCDLPESAVDSGAIYACGRYCDELVPSGLKNATGTDIMEPRFEAHFNHNTRQEAHAIINALASCFRAMAYWAAGAVTVVADAPRDPLFAVTASQTVGGFEFSGPAVRAIKTVAMVSFLDPDDLDRPNMEIYEDFDLIKKYGWNPESITAFACKSKGQAKRLGKWFIETGKLGDTLSYKASIDHLHAQPGDVIVMTERSVVGADLGGRIASAGTASLTLDREVRIEAGKGYTLHISMPDGTVAQRAVTTRAGTGRTLTLDRALPVAPMPEASWVLEVSDLRPRQFRVMGVSDDGDAEYTIAAVPYDPTIYARVERGINIKLPPVSRLPNPGIVQPPSNVRVDRQYINTPSGFTTALQLSWDPSPDAYVKNYTVRWRRDNGNFQTQSDVSGATITLYGETAGNFTFHVQAVNIAGVESRPAILNIFIPDNSPITLIRPTGLEIENQGNDTNFRGRDPVFVWRGTGLSGSYDIGSEPAVGAGFLDSVFRDYEIRVYDKKNALVFVDHTPISRYMFGFDVNSQAPGGPHRAFRFEVVMRDRWGNYSLPASIEVQNPAPAAVTGLEIIGGYGSIFIKFDEPKDLDWEGTLVWMSETTGKAASPETVAYDGPNRFIVLQVPPNVSRYIQVAAYDSFGRTDLNLSGEIKVTSVGVDQVDFLPPAVPTGLTLTDSVKTALDGTKFYELQATWTANTDEDLREYGVEIAEENGQFLHFETDKTIHTWIVQAGVTYRVRLSAYDKSDNNSIYSAEVVHTVAADDEPPSNPTALEITPTFKSIWLKWPQHPDPDFRHMEIHEASVNDRSQATVIANAPGTTFIREGLAGGVDRWYWIRAVDRSGNKSALFFPNTLTGGLGGRTRKVEEADYQELSITNAVIANGAIDTAKISTLDAKVITAGSILSGEVIIGGTGKTISSATQATGDPAAAINQGTTTILPGKISLSGGSTLQSILWGGDNTLIDGNKLATGTVTANKLIIGLRNIEITGVEFTPIKETNRVTWTAGTVNYAGTTPGQNASEAITAGSYTWTSGVAYLYWQIGLGVIGGTTDANITGNPNVVVLGNYSGGALLSITYGRTVIDGSTIRTGTLNADRIQAGTITATQLSTTRLITANAQIGTGVINEANIANGTILNAYISNLSADRIGSGSINSKFIDVGSPAPGEGFITINATAAPDGGNYRYLAYFDNQIPPIARVFIGRVGTRPNAVTDGLYVRDMSGKDILTANGLGVRVAGQDQLLGNSVTSVHAENTSDMQFVSAPSTQNISNMTLVTVNVAASYFQYARLAITDSSGVRYVEFGANSGGQYFGTSLINHPVGVVANSVVRLNVQEISNADFGGIPRNTWFNASAYPFPRQNPYRLVVLEAKR